MPDDLESEMDFKLVEAVLYAIHVLGAKNPASFVKATGMRIKFTGQPSDLADVDDAKTKEMHKRVLAINAKSQVYIKAAQAQTKDANKKREAPAVCIF